MLFDLLGSQTFILFIPCSECWIRTIKPKSNRYGDILGNQDEKQNILPVNKTIGFLIFDFMGFGNMVALPRY